MPAAPLSSSALLLTATLPETLPDTGLAIFTFGAVVSLATTVVPFATLTAPVVDGTGDEPVGTDAPFSESKEQIGGFWVVEAPDLDAALELAARGSKA